jgi:chromosomal replication initiation ATPase DnaA
MDKFNKQDAEKLVHYLNLLSEEHSFAVFRHASRKIRKIFDIPDRYKPDGSPVVFVSTIIKVVADHFGMTQEDITSHKRGINYLTPRHITYFLSFILSGQTKSQIGKKIGKRDHSTIIHGIRKIQKAIKESEAIETLVDNLIEKCLDAAVEEKTVNTKKMKCLNQKEEMRL